MDFINNLIANFSVRNEIKDGRPIMVIPIVALVEGVHSGSGGTAFYPSSEIQKTADLWNGVPLTIPHPTKNGIPISATPLEVQKEFGVGTFENVFFDKGKLKGEGWLDVEKVIDLSSETLVRLKQGETLEVSTGLFSKNDGQEGSWNGEDFKVSVYDFKPNHLAILPNEKGACSVEDGCGVRNNKRCENCVVNQTPKLKKKMEEYFKQQKGGEVDIDIDINAIKKQGFHINELSHGKLRDKLREQVNQMDKEGAMHFLREIFNDRFIFEVAEFESGKSRLFSQKFSMNNKTDEVKLKGDPMEVREKVEFIPLNNKEIKNSSKEVFMDRTEQIASLVSNEHLSMFTEADQDFLTNLEEEKFNDFVALGTRLSECKECNDEEFATLKEENSKLKTEKEELETKITANTEKKIEPLTFDEILANATPEDREQWESGKQMYKDEKDKAITSLVANKRNPFSKEVLEKKSLAELKDLIQLGNIPIDYSGNSPHSEEKEFNVNERHDDGTGVPAVVGLSDSILEKNKEV
jgi:hypothetical protein